MFLVAVVAQLSFCCESKAVEVPFFGFSGNCQVYRKAYIAGGAGFMAVLNADGELSVRSTIRDRKHDRSSKQQEQFALRDLH